MVEVIAYEMNYDKASVEQSTISCIPFEMQYFEQYKSIYNECFYDMRKALEIEPYNFLNDFGQIREKADDIYLLMENSCYCGECNRFERRMLTRLHYM